MKLWHEVCRWLIRVICAGLIVCAVAISTSVGLRMVREHQYVPIPALLLYVCLVVAIATYTYNQTFED